MTAVAYVSGEERRISERDALTARSVAIIFHLVYDQLAAPQSCVLEDCRPALSDRELQCLEWVCRGTSSWVIAETHGCSLASAGRPAKQDGHENLGERGACHITEPGQKERLRLVKGRAERGIDRLLYTTARHFSPVAHGKKGGAAQRLISTQPQIMASMSVDHGRQPAGN